MQEPYLQLLNQNNLTVNETGERTEIRSGRNLFYLTGTGIVGVGFLTFGLLTFELEILLISISIAVLCLLSIRAKRNGRTIFIIDKTNQKIIFPSNNSYESTTVIDLKDIPGISVEQAGGEFGKHFTNYFFAECLTKPELLLTLRKGFKTDHPAVENLKTWLQFQVIQKCD